MKRPIAFAAPILIVMILLVIPLGQLSLGGISEKYLPRTTRSGWRRRTSIRASRASAPNR